MRNKVKKKYLISFLPILYVLMPRSPKSNSEFIIYPVITIVLIFFVVNRFKEQKISKKVSSYILLFFLMFCFLCISSLINSSNQKAIVSLSKIIFYVSVFLYGYTDKYIFTLEEFKISLLNSANLIFIVQIIVGGTQLIGSTIFDPIYSMRKTLPFGTLVRIAGTVVNPNLFGWIVIQLAVIFFLFEKNSWKKILKVMFCFVLVFLSGSRNSLAIFPIAMLLTYLFSTRKDLKFYFFKLPSFLLVLSFLAYLVLNFLYKNQNIFPYMSQLFSIIDSGSLSSVNSFSYRIMMWNQATAQFNNTPGIFKYIFGMGPGTFEVLDNDYLYAMLNYGSLYVICQFFIYFKGCIAFIKVKDIQLFSLGMQYIILSIIIGFQSETFSGWDYPVLILFYIGFSSGIYLSKKGVKT